MAKKKIKAEAKVKSTVANKINIRDGLEVLRSHKRRTVIWPAILIVSEYEFKCTLYDISLGGVRVKLDLPLATGTKVQINIKGFGYTNAFVSWYAEKFVGLRFTEDTDHIADLLGEHAENLF
ncbi:MAG: PilZ domain-containing protein [Emcibacteraceae bacterium]|nr:PilZ domain-containing protein [Emcibacteraceae bacterium]